MMFNCESCKSDRDEKDIAVLEYELFSNCHRFYRYCKDSKACKAKAEASKRDKVI